MEKKLSTVAVLYFVIGLIFAFIFAIYYRWSAFSYFSPGFFSVVLTWPYQAIGFTKDILYYGLAGKPV